MRTEQIHELLEEHFHSVGSAACRLGLARYSQLPATPTKRLGIYGPISFPAPGVERKETDPPVMMVWCPEYLDRLTGDMDDDHLDEFLGIICYVGDMMIALMDEVADDKERFRRIEDRFIDEWPKSMMLMNSVEFLALDLECA